MILSFIPKEDAIKLNYFYGFVFIYLLTFESLLAVLPLARGYYRLTGEVSLCDNEGKSSICLILYKDSNSQREIILSESKWDNSLRSAMGIDVIIEGTLQNNNVLKPRIPPKIRRLSASDLQFSDATSIQRLKEKITDDI